MQEGRAGRNPELLSLASKRLRIKRVRWGVSQSLKVYLRAKCDSAGASTVKVG